MMSIYSEETSMSYRSASSSFLMAGLLIASFAANAQTAAKAVPSPPHSLCIDNNCVTASTPTVSSSAGIKWHPGHYMGSNQQTLPGNGKLSAKQTEQTLLAVSPKSVLGWEGIYVWKTMEDATAGAYDFATLIADYNAVTGWNGSTHVNPRRYMVMVWAQDFSHTDPTRTLPTYITSNSAYGSGSDGSHYGYWNLGTFGQSAAIWRPAVMARIKALFAAMASTRLPDGFTFDTSPYVEAVMFQETSLSLASGSDYTDASLVTQWQDLNASMATAFPHTNVASQANYLATQGPLYSLVQSYPSTRSAASGPDVFGGGTVVNDSGGGITWGQAAYVGYRYNGSAWVAGGTDLRGVVAGIFNIQQPDLTYDGAYTPGQLFTQGDSTLHSTHLVWTAMEGQSPSSANWLGSAANIGSWAAGGDGVLATIVSSPLSHTSCPSNYGKYGGCNTN
jgi:hypothetical protein